VSPREHPADKVAHTLNQAGKRKLLEERVVGVAGVLAMLDCCEVCFDCSLGARVVTLRLPGSDMTWEHLTLSYVTVSGRPYLAFRGVFFMRARTLCLAL